MKPSELIAYGKQQHQIHGKGIVVNPLIKPLKYISNSELLNDLDKHLLNLYNPESQIVLAQPIDPKNLKGIWTTGILSENKPLTIDGEETPH